MRNLVLNSICCLPFFRRDLYLLYRTKERVGEAALRLFLVWLSRLCPHVHMHIGGSPLFEKALLIFPLLLFCEELPSTREQALSGSKLLTLPFCFLCRLQFQYSRTTSNPFFRASCRDSEQRAAQPPPARPRQRHGKHCSVVETQASPRLLSRGGETNRPHSEKLLLMMWRNGAELGLVPRGESD